MKHFEYSLIAVVPWAVCATGFTQDGASPKAGEQRATKGQEFFTRRVLPILKERCWDCHADDVQESGLRLDSRADLTAT